jgi:hypothetical protein
MMKLLIALLVLPFLIMPAAAEFKDMLWILSGPVGWDGTKFTYKPL